MSLAATAQSTPIHGSGIVRPNGQVSPLTQPPISYHGGPVMPLPHNVHLVWYGNWSGNTATTILPSLVSGFRGSAYFNINSGYADAFGTRVVDTAMVGTQVFDNYSQGLVLTDQTLKTVLTQKLQSGALPTDSNAIYFVLTSSDVDEQGSLGEFCVNFCGFHSHASLNGSDIKYAFVGNGERCTASCTPLTPSPNDNIGADAMASVVAHELEETVTDPHLDAWYDSNSDENADKCAWNFGPTFTSPNGGTANMVLGGRYFLIQQNWVNANPGFCGLSIPFQGGSGSEHFFYLDGNSALQELVWTSNTSWTNNNIASFSNGPTLAAGSKLTSFNNSNGEHVYGIGANQHVYEFYWNGGTGSWGSGDLTALTGNTLAASGSPLTSFNNSNGEHIYYVSQSQHIEELYWNSSTSTWSNGHLGANHGNVTVGSGSGLASFSSSN
jgi:Phosphate-induced protein 1 conserved region